MDRPMEKEERLTRSEKSYRKMLVHLLLTATSGRLEKRVQTHFSRKLFFALVTLPGWDDADEKANWIIKHETPDRPAKRAKYLSVCVWPEPARTHLLKSGGKRWRNQGLIGQSGHVWNASAMHLSLTSPSAGRPVCQPLLLIREQLPEWKKKSFYADPSLLSSRIENACAAYMYTAVLYYATLSLVS